MLVCEGAWPTLIGVSCVINFHPGLIWWVHLQDAGSLFSFHPQQPVFIDILISVPDVTFIEYIPLTTIASYRILSWCWDILGLRECDMWYHVDNHIVLCLFEISKKWAKAWLRVRAAPYVTKWLRLEVVHMSGKSYRLPLFGYKSLNPTWNICVVKFPAHARNFLIAKKHAA